MPKPQTHKKWKYDVHPSVRMVQSVIAGMKLKTGHSLDEWVRLAKKMDHPAKRNAPYG